VPAVIDPSSLRPSSTSPSGCALLVLGRRADDLDAAVLEVPTGDHVFIAGSARSGRSTALHRVAAAWTQARPDGRVVLVDRQSPLGAGSLGEALEGGEPLLVVVDDADRVDDLTGELAAIAAGRRHGVTLAVAARIETVRGAYGHWVRDVARSRCGLLMTSAGELDGELLGVILPRRTVIAPRPGLAWMIDRHGHRLVQVAATMSP
jgi:DNA segregation ATPase FtsK/SpoIIIE, S-DNA-T family